MSDSGKNIKTAAMQFLELTAVGQVSQAFELYVGPGFRHHNINFKGDAGSLKAAMIESAAYLPEKKLEIQFEVQEENRVAVYSKVTISPCEPGVALMHFFRFDDEKIVELWDLVQAPPTELINENGLF
jgi:predicted SnoaL-like aldol condensation-catalyzing enzyme